MIRTSEFALERYLSRLMLRSTLTSEERKAILTLPTQLITKKSGVNLSRRGDAIDAMLVVEDGIVGSFKLNRDGSRQITALHIAGDMADQASLMFGESISELEAVSDVSLLRVPMAALLAASDRHPGIAWAIWRDGAADASIQVEWTVSVGSRTARSRLAHLFCEIAARYEQIGRCTDMTFDLPMTQTNLAAATAMTSVHLNRTLQQLRQDGILQMRCQVVEILDWKALTAIAHFNPRYLQLAPGSDDRQADVLQPALSSASNP